MTASAGVVALDIVPELRGFAAKLVAGVTGATAEADRKAVIHPTVSAAGVKAGMTETERSVHTTVARAEKDFLGLRGYIGNVGKTIAGVFVADKIVGFLKDTVRETNNATVVNLALANSIEHNNLLGRDSQKAFEGQANKIENLTGAYHVNVLAADAQLATFRLNQGQIEKLAPLVVDLADKFGISMPMAARLLGRAASGAGAALGRTGIVIDKARYKLDPFGATVDAVTRKAGGFADAYGKSLPGALDRARSKVKDLQEGLGQRLVPALTAVVNFGVNKLLPALQSFGEYLARKILPALAPLVSTLRTGLVAGFTAVGAVLRDVVGPAFRWVGDFIDHHRVLVQSLLVAVGTYVGIMKLAAVATGAWGLATKLMAVAQAALNVVLDANPIGIVVVGLAALAAGLVYAWKHSETFRDIVKEAFRVVSDFILTVISKILGGLAGLFGALGHLPGKLGQPFRDAAAAINTARGKVDDLKNSIDRLTDKTVHIDVVMPNVNALTGVRGVQGIGGYAAGGLITGPGTTTSDSIWARLSAREYVLPAAAVDRYGVAFLDALRRQALPVPATVPARGGVQGYAAGGLVQTPAALETVRPVRYNYNAHITNNHTPMTEQQAMFMFRLMELRSGN